MDLEGGDSPAPLSNDDEQKPVDDKVASDSGTGLSSPSPIKKGLGLKKWRRIPRDATKIGKSSNSSGKQRIEELPDPAPNPTKRGSSYAEKQKKVESSFSPSTDAGLSSENGQEQQAINSPVSVTSGLKINYEIPLVVGSSHDEGRMKLGGKNSGKARIQTMKKHRGKESSRVLSSGVHSSSNGTQFHLNGENGDEVLGTMNQVGKGMETEVGDLPENEVTLSSPVVQNASNENQDPLVEVLHELKTVQEALAKELVLLTEISKDTGESEPETSSQWTDAGKELHGEQSFSQVVAVEVDNREDLGTESEEDLFKKSIEAEVIYTVTANELRSFTLIHATTLEEQKNSFSTDTKGYEDLASENSHLTEATKLEKISEDISKPEATRKRTLRKLASCAFIQLLLVLVIFREFVFQSSKNHGNIVPT